MSKKFKNYLLLVGKDTPISEDKPEEFLKKLTDFSKKDPEKSVSILIRDPKEEHFHSFGGLANDLRSAFKRALPAIEGGRPVQRFYTVNLAEIKQIHTCILELMRQ